MAGSSASRRLSEFLGVAMFAAALITLLAATLESASVEERTDPGLIKERLRVALQRFFRKRSGLRPLVLPVVMEI